MCNTIIWQMSAVFVPASIASIGLAVKFKEIKVFCSFASILLFAIWVFASHLYRRTSAEAREALMQIELNWAVPDAMAVYRRHGQVGFARFSVFRAQIAALISLICFWILFLLYVH